MGRPIDEDIVIDIVNFECGKWTGLSKTIEKEIKALPSAQIDNQIHLCDSCGYSYPECPSESNDVIFGNGKGNDNICACGKYKPSVQPMQRGWICPVCGRGLSPLTMFCPCQNGNGWEITCKT